MYIMASIIEFNTNFIFIIEQIKKKQKEIFYYYKKNQLDLSNFKKKIYYEPIRDNLRLFGRIGFKEEDNFILDKFLNKLAELISHQCKYYKIKDVLSALIFVSSNITAQEYRLLFKNTDNLKNIYKLPLFFSILEDGDYKKLNFNNTLSKPIFKSDGY